MICLVSVCTRKISHTFLLTVLAIPSMPQNLRYIRLPFNTIELHWNTPQNDTDVHFRVTCKRYYGISVWGPCRNISLGVRDGNVTTSPFEIKQLLNNTNYTFSITALNDVSVHVRPEEWNVATIAVHLPWNTAVPKTQIPTGKRPTLHGVADK